MQEMKNRSFYPGHQMANFVVMIFSSGVGDYDSSIDQARGLDAGAGRLQNLWPIGT